MYQFCGWRYSRVRRDRYYMYALSPFESVQNFGLIGHSCRTFPWNLAVVHELILKRGPKFRVGCTPPSYQDFFADSCGSASLFFISTCFQLQKVSVWAWKRHVLMVPLPYGAEFDWQKVLYKTHFQGFIYTPPRGVYTPLWYEHTPPRSYP